MSKNDEHALVPRLRFPEFKDEETWENDELGKLSELFKGKSLAKSDIVEGGKRPCIHYGELFTKYSEVIKEVVSHTNISDGFKSEIDDVLMPTSDVTPNGLAKASCIKLRDVVLGGDILIIRPKPNIFGEFLSRFIRHSENEVLKLVSGTTVFHLYGSSFRKFRLIYPTINEQQKIAACLSSLDEVITAEIQKLEVLKEHKKGLLQNLFPQEGETVPRLRFKEFEGSGEWEESSLGEIGEPLMCKRIFKDQTQSNLKNGIPFYKIGTFGRSADSYILKELYEEYRRKYSFPRAGDILISAAGTIGRLVIYDGSPAYFQDSNIIWLGHNEDVLINPFLFYCYSNLKWQTSDGGIISRLYNSDFKRMKVSFPENKSEQQKIADILISADDLITTQTQKIESLQQHKKGLLQGLFPEINN